jgi:DNA repair protein RadA/Sms
MKATNRNTTVSTAAVDAGTDFNDGVQRLSDSDLKSPKLLRVQTGLGDRNWGNMDAPGIATGSVTLLCGEPGAGTSTLCLQILAAVAKATGRPGLYVEAQESLDNLKARAQRLGVSLDDVLVLNAEDRPRDGQGLLDAKMIQRRQPSIIVIDSVHVVDEVERDAAAELCWQVKQVALQAASPTYGAPPVIVVASVIQDEGVEKWPLNVVGKMDTLMVLGMAAEIEDLRGVVTKSPELDPIRYLTTVRNRYGGQHESYFTMTEAGLRPFTLKKGRKKA